MSIKNKYYQLDKVEFDKYLNSIKSNVDTLHFSLGDNHNYFYYVSKETNSLILKLNKAQWEFDSILKSFSTFSQKQIIQSFLIDEIESTNKIECINSTRHDIFYLINNYKVNKDMKIISICNAYSLFLKTNGIKINTLKDIKNTYDNLLKDSISKEDEPDGLFFRKSHVHISDGTNIIHNGLSNENDINKAMELYLSIYNSDLETYEKSIICHFLFELIHPYYDGNGRLGRYLMSNSIFMETNSLFSITISRAFLHQKSKYYKAFKLAEDIHEFGSINVFVDAIASLLIEESYRLIEELKLKLEKIENIPFKEEFSKMELRIYKLLLEASILSYYGVSSEEIISETNVSKRTLINTLNVFRELNVLEETKIGRHTFYKINAN